MEEKIPSGSTSIDKFYTSDKSHFITVAQWDGEWGISFEVGLRNLNTKEFILAASYLKTKEQALDIAEAIKILLENGWGLNKIDSIFPGLFK